jgi:ubiquinone biosynthesis monooxygenase Coq7
MMRSASLPGDISRHDQLARMLRVDHAGEYGARRIYAGQLAVLKHTPIAAEITHMAEQEKVHLEAFDTLLRARHVRPSALLPFWHVAGFALGAATALLGKEAAMACTVAVESVIGEHYASQIAQLGNAEPELKATLAQFRDEEMEHHDTGLAHNAEAAPLYPVLSRAIEIGCRAAIRIAERF